MRAIYMDGDELVYKFAYACVREDPYRFREEGIDLGLHGLEDAYRWIDTTIQHAVRTLGADKTLIFLNDPHENFRRSYLPTYKLHRKPKPAGYTQLRSYLQRVYGATWKPRLEGDDLVSISVTRTRGPTDRVIYSIDKDFRSVPCQVYNPQKPKRGVVFISRFEADRNHLFQTLMGDQCDGYKGAKGIGEAKANAILDHECSWQTVLETFLSCGQTEDDALMNARCAWILRANDYYGGTRIRDWTPQRSVHNIGDCEKLGQT